MRNVFVSKLPAFVCPNDGRVIVDHLASDDKVICGCGKPNPVVTEGMQRVESRTGVHYKSGLKRTWKEIK